MANPNPFLFGGPPAVSDNPFMDAGGGMGDINPFMAQQAPMMATYNPYSGQQYGTNMAIHQQPEMANPFGDYSSMGYGQQANMMGYDYQQAGNAYYGQQMAHATPTNSVASNALSYPTASVNAGAALFDVAPPATELGSGGTSVYSPPEANPFLTSVQATPPSGMSSVSCTPSAFNPFADDASEEPASQHPAVVADLSVDVSEKSNLIMMENTQNITVDMGEGSETISASLLMVKLDVTEVHSGLAEINPSELSDSETVSLAGEEVKQILLKNLEVTTDQGSMALPEVAEPPDLAGEKDPAEAVEDEQVPGFSGIFSSTTLGLSTDTMQVATSHVDLYSEANQNDGEVEAEVAAVANDIVPGEDEEKSESESEEAEPSVNLAPADDGLFTGGTAAGLFGDADDFSQTARGAGAFEAPKMSTGDALFADMPSMPDVKSTGAAIFGFSDESAAGTTGAQLFDIVAPEASKPSHGAMTGWDENFDRKFEKAEMLVGTGGLAADAFGGGSGSAAAFGYAANPSFAPEPLFGDSFGMLPVSADMNNPFLAAESGLPGPAGGKSGDGETPETPLFDADDSKPLEPFPRVSFESDMWEMFIRHPPKKKITSQRFWKKVFVKIAHQGDTPAILLYDAKDAKDPFQVSFYFLFVYFFILPI
jgi:hypothetical protein